MKYSRITFLPVCLLTLLVGAPMAKSEQSIEAAVIAAEKARGAALVAADMKALDALLADDFRYTHSSGKLETKAVHLGTFADGLRYQRFETSQLHVQVVTPDVAVLNGWIDQNKGKPGTFTDIRLLFQAVWRKEKTGWRLSSLQTAKPPTPTTAAK